MLKKHYNQTKTNTEKANAVHELAEQIGQKLARAEALGEEGMVEESVQLMGEIDELRKKKAFAEQEYRNSMPASSYQQQKLRVCEVCSAYLGIHDNDRRLADHFGGKLHLIFITIREKFCDLKSTVEKRREERGASERKRSGGRRHYVGEGNWTDGRGGTARPRGTGTAGGRGRGSESAPRERSDPSGLSGPRDPTGLTGPSGRGDAVGPVTVDATASGSGTRGVVAHTAPPHGNDDETETHTDIHINIQTHTTPTVNVPPTPMSSNRLITL